MTLVRDALEALGVERLVLSIHDLSFPAADDEDIGHGSPYSRGAEDFFRFASELGFDGVLLGPQGETSLGNPSPYDGSVFSRSLVALPLAVWAREDVALLPRAVVDELVLRTPSGSSRVHRAHAFATAREAVARAAETLARRPNGAGALAGEVAAYAARAPWARNDARFETLVGRHGTDDFLAWPPADRDPSSADAEPDAGWLLAQALLDREHAALRARLAPLALRLYGDLQIGLALRDRWGRSDLMFPGFAIGAPPSRTNPDGQAWGYPVLDPRQYQGLAPTARSPVLDFVRARVDKLFADYDGVRVDHPHGLVCPWVYDAGAADAARAVGEGARLFETPAPLDRTGGALAAVAVARAEQIDTSLPAHADERVASLDAAQIDRYAILFDLLLSRARLVARSPRDILCEVLSTCPRPLASVMKRHGLGRFRVAQKASMTDPRDVYRGENAEPCDWTMLGNHDTEPLRRVLERWGRDEGLLAARADYLATRLEPDAAARGMLASWLRSRPSRLATGMFAELFVGPAANVLVFWADLFGERDVYNRPGVVSDENWRMRVPRSFRDIHGERVVRGEALDVAAALALALRARRVAGPLRGALEARAVDPWRGGATPTR